MAQPRRCAGKTALLGDDEKRHEIVEIFFEHPNHALCIVLF
ncbi:hypothetical protein SODG_001096 [Sodalis praecaptivus]|nr:hypothetical protein NVIRENTERO_00730 [Sodalis praecaptivus]